MIKKIILVLVCYSLFSCDEKKKEEVIDINDVLPSSDRYAEGKVESKDTIIVSYYDSLSSFAQRMTDDLKIDSGSISLIDSLWLPDRFDNKGVEKWRIDNNTQWTKVAHYIFSDSLNMKNCLFNWFDCFGSNCSSVQLFTETKIKSEPFVIYATEKEFVYISSDDLDEKKLLRQMEVWFKSKVPLYVLSQSASGKSKWWLLNKGKWTEFKKEE